MDMRIWFYFLWGIYLMIDDMDSFFFVYVFAWWMSDMEIIVFIGV